MASSVAFRPITTPLLPITAVNKTSKRKTHLQGFSMDCYRLKMENKTGEEKGTSELYYQDNEKVLRTFCQQITTFQSYLEILSWTVIKQLNWIFQFDVSLYSFADIY